MIFSDDSEFNRFIGNTDEWVRSSTGNDETTFRFLSTIESIEEALKRFANLFKTPLNKRDALNAVRDQVKWSFETNKWNYNDVKLLSLLGNCDHPVENFPYISTNLNGVDDDTLYHRIEKFKNQHYSAHRMSLCIRTNLPLNRMKVWKFYMKMTFIHTRNQFFAFFF